MKTSKMGGGTKSTSEKAQGKIKGTGVNKPVVKATIPQIKPGTTYGRPTQTQKL